MAMITKSGIEYLQAERKNLFETSRQTFLAGIAPEDREEADRLILEYAEVTGKMCYIIDEFQKACEILTKPMKDEQEQIVFRLQKLKRPRECFGSIDHFGTSKCDGCDHGQGCYDKIHEEDREP